MNNQNELGRQILNIKKHKTIKHFAFLACLIALIFVNVCLIQKYISNDIKLNDMSYLYQRNKGLSVNDNKNNEIIFRFGLFGYVSLICGLAFFAVINRNYHNYSFSDENSQIF